MCRNSFRLSCDSFVPPSSKCFPSVSWLEISLATSTCLTPLLPFWFASLSWVSFYPSSDFSGVSRSRLFVMTGSWWGAPRAFEDVFELFLLNGWSALISFWLFNSSSASNYCILVLFSLISFKCSVLSFISSSTLALLTLSWPSSSPTYCFNIRISPSSLSVRDWVTASAYFVSSSH